MPEPLLERPDLQADRRLGDAEPLCRLREASPLDDRAEGRELTCVHKPILSRPRGSAQLEPVSERIVDEQPVDAFDSRVVLELDPPARRRSRIAADPRRRARDGRGRPARTVLDADMELLFAGAEPAATARSDRFRLRELLHAEHTAVERARVALAAGRSGDLNVVDAENCHRPKVYHRHVAAQLEDTLVSGYRRLAAETPRRWIDVELRALDILFATIFGLVLLPLAAVLTLLLLVRAAGPCSTAASGSGRGGRFFTMIKFRTLDARRRDAASARTSARSSSG